MSTESTIALAPGLLTDPSYMRSKHLAGLPYAEYAATGKPHQVENWQRVYEQAVLNDRQKAMIGSFVRRINVIGLSGIWCGDCVQQCPLIQRIAEASELIDLRWLDRDEHADVQQQVRINGGNRVPVLIFCAEDYEMVGWFGDRTLSRYRALAQRQLGTACPLPGAPIEQADMASNLQDWVDQFERVHLLLRLSGRLRERYGD
jgi:hypothetical protein